MGAGIEPCVNPCISEPDANDNQFNEIAKHENIDEKYTEKDMEKTTSCEDGDNGENPNEDLITTYSPRIERTQSNFTKILHEPRTLNELTDIIQTASNTNKKIKAIGSRYGFTKINETDDNNGILIDMRRYLHHPSLQIDRNTLNNYGQSLYNTDNLLLAESGTTYEMIWNHIWPENDRRNLKNKGTNKAYKVWGMIGHKNLSIGGTISCGATAVSTYCNKLHGSMTNSVRSLCLVTLNEDNKVQIYQIEPDVDNGAIHDKITFNECNKDIILIQDDEVFESCLVSFGVFGVVYSYFVELEDAYFVYETKQVKSWDEYKNNDYAKYIEKSQNGEILHSFLWVSPYTTKQYPSSPPVLVVTQYKTDKIPPEVIDASNAGSNKGPIWMSLLGAALGTIVHKTFPSQFPWVLQSFLEAQQHNGVTLLPGFLSGNASNKAPNQTNGIGIDAEYFLECMQDWFHLMEQKRETNEKQLATGGMMITFSSKPKGYLSMYTRSNDAGVLFEQPIVEYTDSNWSVLGETVQWKNTLDSGQEMMMNKYNGCVHWGLYFDYENSDVFRNIDADKMRSFIKCYQKFNASKAFCNNFTVVSGLDKKAGFQSSNYISIQ